MENRIIKLQNNNEIRAIEGNSRQFEFVISTEDIDTHRTIFLASGLDLSRYVNNNVVTYGHPDMNSNNPDDIIGTSEIRTEGTSTIAVLTLEEEGSNPVADKVARKLASGVLKMASIRAIPTEAEFQQRNGEDIKVFTQWRLLDWGVVSHGSNPAALARSIEEAADELIVKEETIKDETIKEAPNTDAISMEIESF